MEKEKLHDLSTDKILFAVEPSDYFYAWREKRTLSDQLMEEA